jgi:hypothetical protein
VLSLNKKTHVKNIYISLFMIQPYVEHHRDAALLKWLFIKNKPGQSVWFRTPRYESLLFYENLFYIRNKKNDVNVPKNIHKLLTPRALAYWFMDDGSSQWSKTTNRLNCVVLPRRIFFKWSNFSLQQKLYGLNVNVHRDGSIINYTRMRWFYTHLQDLIRAYVHDDFIKLDQYKLEPRPE